jgi:hypothetical protein
MHAEASRLRDALPVELREHWDRIAAIDAGLVAALAEPAEASFAELALERQRALEEFLAALPLTAASAGLRESALRHLLRANESLQESARAALADAADVSAAASRQRKAISAYARQSG